MIPLALAVFFLSGLAALLYQIERIVSVEIIGPQFDTLQRYGGLQPYGEALRVLTEARIQRQQPPDYNTDLFSKDEFDPSPRQ